MAGPEEEHGSDITQYPEVQEDSTLRDIAQGTPVVSGVSKTAEDIYGAVAGDDRLASLQSIPGDIMGLGMSALMAMRDPIYALASAGLTIVLELVEPFNDLIHAVSGDPDEMQVQIDVWEQVATALTALQEETAGAVNDNLTSWTGEAADAAYEQLGGLEASIYAAANEVTGVQTLLEWAKLLAETIYEVIKSILAELVSWLITRGLVALANSAWSFGASVAAFLLSAAYKSYSMFSRAFKKLTECSRIFKMLLGGLGKFLLNNPVITRGAGNWINFLAAVGAKAGIAAGKTAGLGAVSQGKTMAKDAAGSLLNPYQGTMSRGGGQVSVDPDELVQTAGALEGLVGNVDSIQSVASDAAAAEMTWGVPGIWFADRYRQAGEELAEIIGNISSSHTSSATSLRDCADDYSGADEDSASEFGNLQGELDGVA
ncbi:type VII secretion target [Glycomyces tenuis]|uniref:type VII secretion target n=1 Tax=Glycomyces tenuis TaxID=58116 RepID=UPI0004232425|nr:type VII secretion target [Glycomyces tenuis]